MVQTVYNNNNISGAACVLAAYYFYTTLPKENTQHFLDSSSEMTSATPDIPIPTYEQTSDAL
jgi:hypothetical protein